MIKLLKNANVYAPEKLGKKDILVEGEKILLMRDSIEGYEGLQGVETYDLTGKTVVPAYIDLHVHITGGGGEQGPASRVPESQLSEFFKNGITTVVGLLGTDGVTRSVENLVAKARALTEEGMTVYTLTSSYGYPPTTLTGSVERDIILGSADDRRQGGGIRPQKLQSWRRGADRAGNRSPQSRSSEQYTGTGNHAYGRRGRKTGSGLLCSGSLRCSGQEPASDPYFTQSGSDRRRC